MQAFLVVKVISRKMIVVDENVHSIPSAFVFEIVIIILILGMIGLSLLCFRYEKVR